MAVLVISEFRLSMSDGAAVAVICIFIVIFVQVLQSLLQLSVVISRRIQLVSVYALALLRDNVPDQVPPCNNTAENGRMIFHG